MDQLRRCFRNLLDEAVSAVADPQQPHPTGTGSGTFLSSVPHFRYTPLRSPSNFRILRLEYRLEDYELPSWRQRPLRGSLIEASIESPPRYFALSYTWGDPALVDCAAALRRMMKGKTERVIWVDSICINQGTDPEALAERSGQIAMMDSIYRSAYRVNVHLGPGDAASDVACEVLKKLSLFYYGATLPGPQKEFFKRKYEKLATEVLEWTPEFPYGKLHGVFRLPWFRPVGSDFTRIPVSKWTTDWASGGHLMAAAHWRSYVVWHHVMQEFVRRYEQGEPVSSFGLGLSAILVPPALALEATRPEDKIYGLYAVCKRFGFELPAPDYTKPLAVVYTEGATAALRCEPASLETLSWVCESPKAWERGLPSWVPDFSGCIRNWSPSNPPHMTVPLMTMRQSRLNAASGGTQCQYEFELDGQALNVRGRRVDVVCAVGVPWSMDNSTSMLGGAERPAGQDVDTLVSCVGSWFDVAQQGLSGSGSSGPLHVGGGDIDAMKRLAYLLALDVFRPLSVEQLDELVRYLSILVTRSKSGSGNPSHTLPLAHPQDGPVSDYSFIGEHVVSDQMLAIIKRIVPAALWKTVFRTARGEYLGLGTHTVRVGDVVAVFHGCPHAAVLRPWGEWYRYVGPAYVEGVMDGGWWRNYTTAEDDERFVLI
ncbi:hypothetical protein MAPG_09908 [Magnaporthiopsis poae ATCC 64411]|uniref:Heterokaryon incompatibility domain-containing protein n=1 Tax=Magnaporthiopsis poae (strain ATCC 64411 / 73-15) TaxID=644358 RepID=A0A0C4EB62_MAGP6|nr:hypothetical protein MAPG_09908 [Magnaporthiopsis poae ATCC 64411]